MEQAIHAALRAMSASRSGLPATVTADLGPAAGRVRSGLRRGGAPRGRRRRAIPSRDIVSGAGHDAAYVSRVAPAAMIFVPCRGGISHNEAEFSSKEQCAAGAQVLLQAVLDYDRQLAERSRPSA